MRVTVEVLEFEQAPFRTPFKFGAAVMKELTIPEVTVSLEGGAGAGGPAVRGHGAMPLGNAWSFPAAPYEESLAAMRAIVERLAKRVHGLELPDDVIAGSMALREVAMHVAREVGAERFGDAAAIPDLCTLVCFSAFDIALFDAWGRARGENTFAALRGYGRAGELSQWLGADYQEVDLGLALTGAPVELMPIFQVVGGLDPLTPAEVQTPVEDGLPNDLQEWTRRDGLTHFKLKMRGNDPEWDFARVVAVDRAVRELVKKQSGAPPVYSLDMNEQCPAGSVLLGLLERLRDEAPAAFAQIQFVEQPTNRTSLDGRHDEALARAATLKPVVLDEGLTSLAALEAALQQGYSGVCLKACKGIGFSMLAAAVARKRDLFLCVQDLTWPGLAFVASAGLAAWTGVDGLEANARQFCPGANARMAAAQPELFTVRDGAVTTANLTGAGMSYGD